MKKTILLLGVIVTLLFCNVTNAFADAISYDMEKAGYYVYVATPDGGLNIRSGPGTEYNRVMEGRIPDGVRLYIEYVSGNWGLTSYNGTQGWVALKQTTTAPPQVQVTPEPEVPAETPQSTPTAEVVTTAEPEKTATAPVTAEVTETGQENSKETETGKTTMLSQIVLALILVLLVAIVAILIVIIINLKAKR